MSAPDTTHPPAPSSTRPPASRARRVLLGVLVLWLVVGIVVAGVVAQRLVSRGAGADPFAAARVSDAGERAQVTSVAEQFTLRMDNVDGAKFDDYVTGITQMLTTKAKAENKETLEVLEQSYREAEVKGTGKVLVSGVSDVSDDEATVLVAHDAQVSTNQGDIEHHYRWSIDLVKVDGDWLVDGFTPVT